MRVKRGDLDMDDGESRSRRVLEGWKKRNNKDLQKSNKVEGKMRGWRAETKVRSFE